MDWKERGGTIINKSGRTLIVAFDSPTEDDRWAYMPLSHNRKTAFHIDADGFRVREEGIKISYQYPGTARLGWWKIRNGMLATVYSARDNEGNSSVNFEVELKSPDGSLRSIYFAVGAAVTGPKPMTDKDYEWNGKTGLIAEASEAIS